MEATRSRHIASSTFDPVPRRARPRQDPLPATVELQAPAKLTVSLRVIGVRDDGYHLIDAEMVTVDLSDTLFLTPIDPPGGPAEAERARQGGTERARLEVVQAGTGLPVATGPENSVHRAIELVGRRAAVRLVKRIPAGGGLGGASADAAAVLRWCGISDADVAVAVGADVPFCLVGGRARVRGIGEMVEPLPFEPRTFTLAIPPFGCSTRAVYAAWDRLAAAGACRDAAAEIGSGGAGAKSEDGGTSGARWGHGGGGEASASRRSPHGAQGIGPNDLEEAALLVEPRLAAWRDRLAAAAGERPVLAGSGSTWFVEGEFPGAGRIVVRTCR